LIRFEDHVLAVYVKVFQLQSYNTTWKEYDFIEVFKNLVKYKSENNFIIFM